MKKKLLKITKEAGEILKEGFYDSKNITHKGELDLVTEYDVRIEKFLISKFNKAFPEFNIIGEESDNLADEKIYNTFIIDPIDGTTNFVNQFPQVSISIAVYKEGNPYIGIVYNPITNELFLGKTGKGATLNGRKLSVFDSSNPNENRKGSMGAVFLNPRYEASDKEIELTSKITEYCNFKRGLGSAALETCYVASGALTVLANNRLKPWDVSAGMIILKEAGGYCFDFNGNEIDFSNFESFIATNDKDLLKKV